MTPAARIAAAIDILEQVLTGQAAEKAFLAWSRRSRFAGSKDRAALRDIVFQCLRCRRSYAAVGGGLSGRGLVRGYISEIGQDEVDVFGNGRHAPDVQDDPPLTPFDALSEGDRCDLQDWVLDRFRQDYGNDAIAIARSLRDQAPVWLRVNAQRATPEGVLAALADAGFDAEAADDLPGAIQVARPARGLVNTQIAQDGLIEFQDIGSQRAVAALGDLTGLSVLDYCAGGGGKSLAFAAAGASITAHDRDPRRMSDLAPRAKRAQAAIRQKTAADLERALFDVVACDVPCSGSGAWRRAVDTKWTLTPDQLSDMVAIQRQIVEAALQYVKPGGRLVYMTCSLFALENIAQAAWISETLQIDLIEQQQMTPLDGGDGFFVAVFQA